MFQTRGRGSTSNPNMGFLFGARNLVAMVSQLWLLLASVVLLRLFKARPLASRDKKLPPSEERVVLLGASSGVGRDLAHAYAKRGARL